MKTVTGRVTSEKPITLSRAATLLSGFVSKENEASQDVRAYLRRASAAFTELKSFHREIRSSTKSESGGRSERNPSDEVEELRGREQVEKKKKSREDDVVEEKEMVKLVEEQGKKERKKKKNKGEDVVNEKVDVKVEEEQRNDERKEKKKKSKKNKGEDVVDEKVNEESKERKKKKKRKSDGEIGSEETKSKKKRKSKDIDA